jgi:hypothetical protein
MSATPIIDAKTEELMKPLCERGIAEYKRTFAHLPPEKQPIGVTSSMTIVREDDFVKFAALCLRHVLFNGRTLYVLCKDDHQLCAVLAQRRQ